MTTSKCIACDVAQVKRQMYTLASDPWRSSMNSAPVKSTPVTLNRMKGCLEGKRYGTKSNQIKFIYPIKIFTIKRKKIEYFTMYIL